MIVKLLGHACVYLQIDGHHILMDPWLGDTLLGRFRRFPDPGPLNFDFPPPDLLLISHHHWDHVHIPTLLRFDRSTPVLIPENEQLQRVLQILGFCNVKKVKPWKSEEYSWGKVWPTRSRVPFGEVGYLVESAQGSMWNMVDTVFSEVEVNQAMEMTATPIRLCLAPFQSFDEMGVIMRDQKTSESTLARSNARVLSKLETELLVPFADGLYYPGNSAMNKISFTHDPFEFIDEVHSFRDTQNCLVPVPFDEFSFDEGELRFQRPLGLEVQTLLSLYQQYRTLDPNESYRGIPERIDGLNKSLNIEELKLKVQRYFEGGVDKFFQQSEKLPQGKKLRVEDFYRHEGIRWALEIEGGQRVLVLDFTTNPWSILASDSEANCGLTIRAEDLSAILDSVELLSILTQSCSVTTWGQSSLKAYQSLNVLWYAGFEDRVRLESYLKEFQRNDILNS